jgi:hypothetical protein
MEADISPWVWHLAKDGTFLCCHRFLPPAIHHYLSRAATPPPGTHATVNAPPLAAFTGGVTTVNASRA